MESAILFIRLQRLFLKVTALTQAVKEPFSLKQATTIKYDLFIGMDSANIRNMTRILGGDKQGKIHKLMEYTGSNADVSDPWYTRDFDRCYKGHLCRLRSIAKNSLL